MLIPHVHTLHSCMISRPASSLPSLPVPPFPLGIGTSHHSNLYTFLQGFSFLPIPIHKFPVLSTSTVLLFINCSHTWLLMDINCEGRKKHPLIAPTPVCGGDAKASAFVRAFRKIPTDTKGGDESLLYTSHLTLDPSSLHYRERWRFQNASTPINSLDPHVSSVK